MSTRKYPLEPRGSVHHVDPGLVVVAALHEDLPGHAARWGKRVAEAEVDLFLLPGRERRRAVGVEVDPGRRPGLVGLCPEPVDAVVVEADVKGDLKAAHGVAVVVLEEADEIVGALHVRCNPLEVGNGRGLQLARRLRLGLGI
jgi:hypothetical protein